LPHERGSESVRLTSTVSQLLGRDGETGEAVEVEMIGHWVKERGDAKGNQAEPRCLCQVESCPMLVVQPNFARFRGNRPEAGNKKRNENC
jgi:hypothetical protein